MSDFKVVKRATNLLPHRTVQERFNQAVGDARKLICEMRLWFHFFEHEAQALETRLQQIKAGLMRLGEVFEACKAMQSGSELTTARGLWPGR
jgi:hypothetical protein